MKCAGRAGGALRVCVIVSVCREQGGEEEGKYRCFYFFLNGRACAGDCFPGSC